MRAVSSSTLSASTWAVVMLVVNLPWSSSLRASHLETVRLAIIRSVNTSLFWQHLTMATRATPPQPITNTLAMFCILLLFQNVLHVLGQHKGADVEIGGVILGFEAPGVPADRVEI